MSGKLMNLFDGSAVLQRVRDGRLSQRVNPHAAPSNTVGVNPDRSRILLYGLPYALTLEIFSLKRPSVLVEWPLFRPLQIILDAGGSDIFEQSGRGFKQFIALTLAPLFFRRRIYQQKEMASRCQTRNFIP
jgi:hypothetical protein